MQTRLTFSSKLEGEELHIIAIVHCSNFGCQFARTFFSSCYIQCAMDGRPPTSCLRDYLFLFISERLSVVAPTRDTEIVAFRRLESCIPRARIYLSKLKGLNKDILTLYEGKERA